MLPNPVTVDPKAVGNNNPKAVAVDPTRKVKLVEDKGGGLAGRAAGGLECLALPAVEGTAWVDDNPNANGAAEVIAPPSLKGLDTGAGIVPKFKPVLLTAIVVMFVLSATNEEGDAAPNTKGTAGMALAVAGCSPKEKPGVAKDAGLVGAFVAPNTMASAM
jgi:hypothetical protein